MRWRWRLVIVDWIDGEPPTIHEVIRGPRFWCRFAAWVNNLILSPIPDFRVRYEARSIPKN